MIDAGHVAENHGRDVANLNDTLAPVTVRIVHTACIARSPQHRGMSYDILDLPAIASLSCLSPGVHRVFSAWHIAVPAASLGPCEPRLAAVRQSLQRGFVSAGSDEALCLLNCTRGFTDQANQSACAAIPLTHSPLSQSYRSQDYSEDTPSRPRGFHRPCRGSPPSPAAMWST